MSEENKTERPDNSKSYHKKNRKPFRRPNDPDYQRGKNNNFRNNNNNSTEKKESEKQQPKDTVAAEESAVVEKDTVNTLENTANDTTTETAVAADNTIETNSDHTADENTENNIPPTSEHQEVGNKIESKIKEQFSDKDHSQVENLDQYLDMDIRTGSNPEADAIAANIFLTRGLNEKPDVETAHCREYRYNCCKLATYDWIEQMDISLDYLDFNIAEVRFKNSHKDFYILPEEGVFHVGDIVAVEASPGHDIGIISMLGLSVKRQLEHKRLKPEDITKKLYRLARVSDIDKWISTVDLEHTTMLSSRYIAWDLNLKMKVNDVEYQGDGTKAIFYYSAEERVDFRELIKILAEQFRIRIEMRQIGVRQEAARLGGIGTCGRELCCSAWLTNFQSVSTNTARTQQLSLNPQKLAGMCGKLKCCLNFEQSTYIEESKGFPAPNVHLKTKKGKCFYNKIDIFKKIVWYSYADDNSKIFAIPLEKVNEIIKMNSEGKYPETLEEFAVVNQAKVEEGVSYSMDELKRIEDR